MSSGKNILLGVTGSIAVYKSVYLTRLLKKHNHEVQVILTEGAKMFISPLTFATLSGKPALSDFRGENGTWNNHVELGLWADVLLIAPATANTLAKMTTGICDNLLMAVYLSARCPVMVAPAMDADMYQHATTAENLKKLEAQGVHIIPVESGELASGLTGEGRMAEPETILNHLGQLFTPASRLAGKKVLVTAGPTREPIDPVRFISNHSTGKMGFAIAKTFAEAGASVTLVSGPVSLPVNHPAITRIDVETAEEMYAKCLEYQPDADIIIMTAAVVDFTPARQHGQKIKKDSAGHTLHLELTRTPDILKTLGERKKRGQILVGFALETENPVDNALKKLREKNCDLIVLNTLGEPGTGFASETNRVMIIDRHENIAKFDLKPKSLVARDILEAVIKYMHE